MIIFFPIGLIIRLVLLCEECFRKRARERALRREQEEAEEGLLAGEEEPPIDYPVASNQRSPSTAAVC